VAERDADAIKQEIDRARDQLASTRRRRQGPGHRVRQEARGGDLAGWNRGAGRCPGGPQDPQSVGSRGSPDLPHHFPSQPVDSGELRVICDA
jgi:hypothetical protein